MPAPGGDLGAAMRDAYPELDAVREVAGEEPVFLVGGAVRDLLLGRGRADIDLVVEGDAAALAARLGADPVEHERFATAKVDLDGHEVDIATARAETYPHPGALPEVSPARIEDDLARRDFTINAMAIPLMGDPKLIDPRHGHADLEDGVLRVLHENSFVDDPTRALRAARYAARFGFLPEPRTEELLREAGLGTVSDDRRGTELLRIAAESRAPAAFDLLAEWGVMEPREGGVELAARVIELLASPVWSEVADRDRAVLVAALGPAGAEVELARMVPNSPSEAVELAHRHSPVELVLARAMGAEWLDRYLEEWRAVKLEIDGEDLIAAGIAEGPALGRGLREALRLKLDGQIAGREPELEVALEAARRPDEVG
jgi:tRNA nucleotidyltransferase (CCA-adding enzyme)